MNRHFYNENQIPPSELIINEEGRIYHLDLHPSEIANDIIIVGDQERVPEVSKYFDKIEIKRNKREFVTHTGTIGNKKITALSTGIGCDNIDIVMNELDALVNIDFETRTPKKVKTKLNIIRIGSTGALQKDIPIDSFVISKFGLGFDNLMGFYNHEPSEKELDFLNAFLKQTNWPKDLNKPYFSEGNNQLIEKIGNGLAQGITATASGFYGPQGRVLRLIPRITNLNEKLNLFNHQNHQILNFEMETSALYGLSNILGHNSCTVCAVIANRFTNSFSKNYKKPIEKLIELVLERIC